MRLDELVPADRVDAVRAALRAAGAAGEMTAEPIHGGLSGARLLAVSTGSATYAVRVIDPAKVDQRNPPTRWIPCLRLAAERGLAPPLLHAAEDGLITVSAFIEKKPLGPALARPGLVDELGALVRAVHALPGFPPFISVVEFAVKLVAAARVMPAVPELARTLADGTQALLPLLLRHADEAACHNDLNPNNFIWDGERFWLVDWEAGGRGDPFHDVATLLLFFRALGGRDEALLAAVRGQAPSARDLAKLRVMRQVGFAFYGLQPMLAALGAGFAPGATSLDDVPGYDAWLANAAAHVDEGSRGALGKIWELGLVVVKEGLRLAEAPDLAEAVARLSASG